MAEGTFIGYNYLSCLNIHKFKKLEVDEIEYFCLRYSDKNLKVINWSQGN